MVFLGTIFNLDYSVNIICIIGLRRRPTFEDQASLLRK